MVRPHPVGAVNRKWFMSRSDIKWRVNTNPRFTVLELGEYMAADDGPRETMLRDMRYERLARTLIYRHLRLAVTKFVASPTRDRSILEHCRLNLEDEKSSATSTQQGENLAYELRALDAFENSLNALGLGGLNFLPAPPASPLKIEGVTVSVQPTAHILISRPRGSDLAGALIVDLAKGTSPKTPEAIAKMANGMVHAAVLIHEYVANALPSADTKASPEHSIVFHSHRQERVCAPASYRRMLRNVEAVCRNIARSWDGIKPPPAYDPAFARTRR